MFKAEWFKGCPDSPIILAETPLPGAASADEANAAAKALFGGMWDIHKPDLRGFRILDSQTGRIVRAFDASL
jgi:hypothetical protein